jgi:hypothetical protein
MATRNLPANLRLVHRLRSSETLEFVNEIIKSETSNRQNG